MSKGGQQQASQPVNPSALAAAQQQTNIATAQQQASLQNINEYSPYGSSVYTPFTDPTTGQQRYSLQQSLSPQLQSLFNQQTGLAGQISGAAPAFVQGGQTLGTLGLGLAQQGTGYAGNIAPVANLANVPNINFLTPGSFRTNVTGGAGGQPLTPVQTAVNTNFPQLVQQAQNAAYGQQTQYLDPQFAQARQQMTQQLADQGIQPGTEAYDRATGDFNRQQQMAYGNAQLQAVQAGNAQQQALFGQSIAGGQFANQAQQQMFGQGTQLADLYNQAVLGAANQNLQAQSANLNLAQTAWQDPQQAAQTLMQLGTGAFGQGLGALQGALPAVNAAPSWPLSIPTMGGFPATVPPTNLAGITSAAQGQNALANMVNQQQWQNIGGLATRAAFGNQGLGSIFGSGGLFGGGGLLSNLFGGGAALTPEAAGAASGFGSAFGAGAIDLGKLF